MKKRVLAIALVTALVGSMLAGCGSKGSEGGAGTDAPAAADGAKVVKIGVYEPASGDNGAGFGALLCVRVSKTFVRKSQYGL